MTQANPIVKISPNSPTFDLPIIVALEHGLFEKAGIDVRYSAEYADNAAPAAQSPDPLSRLKEKLFEQGAADTYNLCEWGGIDRLERSKRGGKVAALRAAVVAQAIVSFDKSLQVPRDLADVAIGINDYTGSHYTTLQLLEGAVGKEHVKTVHASGPHIRLEKLKKGELRAATLMEPYISLALKQGAHIIASTFYRGAEVISDQLNPEQRQAYFDAINQAVDIINKDFARYSHHIVESVKGHVKPEDIGPHFLRYEKVEVYAPETFQQAYDWMQERGLSDGRHDHKSLVVA